MHKPAERSAFARYMIDTVLFLVLAFFAGLLTYYLGLIFWEIIKLIYASVVQIPSGDYHWQVDWTANEGDIKEEHKEYFICTYMEEEQYPNGFHREVYWKPIHWLDYKYRKFLKTNKLNSGV